MRVLVTGGAGFIGSHVVDALVDAGCSVRVLDHLHPAAHDGAPAYLNPSAEYEWCDLRDVAAVEAVVEDVDAISHQASMVGLGESFQDVTDYVSHNAVGTASLLRALDAVGFAGRLVLASSMVVYGEGAYECRSHGPIRPPARTVERLDAKDFEPRCPACAEPLTPRAILEVDPADPNNVYAATKLHQEHLCAIFGRELAVPVAMLRYHNVYGPRMPRDTPYAGVASIFRSALEQGRSPRVFEDGEQLRDFVHVRDVARANVIALTRECPVRGAFNIATGRPRSVRDLAFALSDAFGTSAARPIVTGAYRLGDVRHVVASPERAARDLGWEAVVGFEEGIGAFAMQPLRARANGQAADVAGTIR